MTYSEQLKSVQWHNIRETVKLRDSNQCVECTSRHYLHVHHTYYDSSLLMWEYPIDSLITLCAICHKKLHDTTKITKLRKPIDREKKVIEKTEKLNKISNLIVEYKTLIDNFTINNDNMFVNYEFNLNNTNKIKFKNISIFEQLNSLRIKLFGLKVSNIEEQCIKISKQL